jgi:hypothetical protein
MNTIKGDMFSIPVFPVFLKNDLIVMFPLAQKKGPIRDKIRPLLKSP